MMTLIVATGLLLGVFQETPGGAAPQDKPKDLTELSLEDLSNLEVTTASRKSQRLADVPAAVGVVRGEDIRRMGVRTIPDALRMIPGVEVARIDGGKWAISIRGFNQRFSNKIQVLVDGRSIYDPLFSGVFWEMEDTLIEDIDRIEVVRGPGGATWGANAVNGVINIITKKSSDTQGAHAHAGGGTEELDFGGARYGGKVGDVSYRAFAKWVDRDNQFKGHDDYFQARGGFRADWKASEQDTVTLSGEYGQGTTGTQSAILFNVEDYEFAGGFLMARWDRKISDTSSLSTQVAYTRTDYTTQFFHETRDTLDLDFSHRFRLMESNDIVWGLGFRVTADRIGNSAFISMVPDQRTDDVETFFIQDELAISGDALKLILGARAEYNDYTGFELSPTARIAFRPHENHLIWAAVSRAVRTPSRADSDIVATFGPTYQVVGNDHLQSEEQMSYELGYRVTPIEKLSFDLALFTSNYDHLQTTEVLVPPPPALVTANGNKGNCRSYGIELASNWQVQEWWRLYGAVTVLKMNFKADSDSTDFGYKGNDGNDPQGQVYLRSSFDVTSTLAVDVMGRYVGSQPSNGVARYYDMDARVGWRAAQHVELSVVGQNLLHPHHFEAGNTSIGEVATQVERGVYFMVRLDF